MANIKVMVVDDSAFMRKIISDMIARQKDMEVVGKARNGLDALEKIEALQPDVITLDIEMPQMDGLTTLKKIHSQYDIPVIMLSSLTVRGSQSTMEALASGAMDFIAKPSGAANVEIIQIEEELTEKIRHISFSRSKVHKTREIIKHNPSFEFPKSNYGAIVIGASTGGPKTLFEIVSNLPTSKTMPIFIVQHMPMGFTTSFAERLNNHCSLLVKEATDGEEIIRGQVYIAPGDYHMTLEGNRIRLNQQNKIWGVRPAVDYLFESAARIYGERLLGVILTGMGKDGTEGMKEIKKYHGTNIAQSKESSIIFGMPGSAIASGVVDQILSLEEISLRINEIIKRC